jgi:hypothetical protein
LGRLLSQEGFLYKHKQPGKEKGDQKDECAWEPSKRFPFAPFGDDDISGVWWLRARMGNALAPREAITNEEWDPDWRKKPSGQLPAA